MGFTTKFGAVVGAVLGVALLLPSASWGQRTDKAAAAVGRAEVYFRQHDYEGAIAELTKALKYQPDEYSTWYNRAFAHFALDQYELAQADYSEAIRLHPMLAAAYNNRCLTRAIIGKDLGQAMGDCDQALKLMPNSNEVRDTRGFVYLRMGDFAKAIVEYDTALQIDPKHARALYGRGYAKIKIGDTNGGASDMAAALKLETDLAEQFAKKGVR